jgi:hypothetical protein
MTDDDNIRKIEKKAGRPLLLHCIYCGNKIQVQHILAKDENESDFAVRLAFELEHNQKCGPKSVGMIIGIE